MQLRLSFTKYAFLQIHFGLIYLNNKKLTIRKIDEKKGNGQFYNQGKSRKENEYSYDSFLFVKITKFTKNHKFLVVTWNND